MAGGTLKKVLIITSALLVALSIASLALYLKSTEVVSGDPRISFFIGLAVSERAVRVASFSANLVVDGTSVDPERILQECFIEVYLDLGNLGQRRLLSTDISGFVINSSLIYKLVSNLSKVPSSVALVIMPKVSELKVIEVPELPKARATEVLMVHPWVPCVVKIPAEVGPSSATFNYSDLAVDTQYKISDLNKQEFEWGAPGYIYSITISANGEDVPVNKVYYLPTEAVQTKDLLVNLVLPALIAVALAHSFLAVIAASKS